jgi:transposase-like protein
MFGKENTPPVWQGQFEKAWEEEYGRQRYICKTCLRSFSVTAARQHAKLPCVLPFVSQQEGHLPAEAASANKRVREEKL